MCLLVSTMTAEGTKKVKSMDKIDQLVKTHYLSQQPDQEWLDAVLADKRQPIKVRRLLQIAAILLICVTVGVLYRIDSSQYTTDMVLLEVAMNHEKNLAPEVHATDYESIQKAMHKIRFQIKPPKQILADYNLIGARYCSVAGTLAVQLKLRHKSKFLVDTLFITTRTEGLATIGDERARVGDTNISLWSSPHLFFALATNGVVEPPQ